MEKASHTWFPRYPLKSSGGSLPPEQSRIYWTNFLVVAWFSIKTSSQRKMIARSNQQQLSGNGIWKLRLQNQWESINNLASKQLQYCKGKSSLLQTKVEIVERAQFIGCIVANGLQVNNSIKVFTWNWSAPKFLLRFSRTLVLFPSFSLSLYLLLPLWVSLDADRVGAFNKQKYTNSKMLLFEYENAQPHASVYTNNILLESER